VSKNVAQLLQSIDSTHNVAIERSRDQSSKLIKERYFGRENGKEQIIPTQLTNEQYETHNIDSLWASLDVHRHRQALSLAYERALNYRDQIEYNAIMLNDSQRYIRKHEIELYRKFTLAFACLIFFFIGAPLGAIIRKGGLGAPVVISVIMFIVYYIIDNTGYKMAREALWPSWAGMWLSSFILLPIGIFLTYKAATDSPLFNPEAWSREWQKIKQDIQQRYGRWILEIKKIRK
ncbi:MAG: LptF/LptG family permease, partial [Paludibacteraceae bacterium]|nr:LptF/LptG family permease [Paludibacteraceae bacterium]